MSVRRVSVLGATGSIGTSTLDVIARDPSRFEVVALTAHTNAEGLAAAARASRAKMAVIADEAHYRTLKDLLAGTGIEVAAGSAAIEASAAAPADCVVAAMMGAAGLKPALVAVAQGRRVALANKECLVTAGTLFMAEVARHGAELVPIDSEHCGVMQALAGACPEDVDQILITASGGPFRTWDLAAMAKATPAQALKHPNWQMGRKITIDSATLMNKGLELIEAHHLFGVAPSQLDVLVHPQSIVHALVAYRDGSVLAQLANPDMRLPIACALNWPLRLATPTERLDLVKLSALTFEAPDRDRFRALALAEAALRSGGAATAVMNAANEIAVEAFLDGRIGFLDIAATVEETLGSAAAGSAMTNTLSIDDILCIDGIARRLARDCVTARR